MSGGLGTFFFLDAPQLLLGNKPDMKGCPMGLTVKKADQEVQRKLELSRRAAIQPKMPALHVVVGSDGLREHARRGRRLCVACDPVPADVVH